MSIFAIGDIHGCLDRLERLLRRLPLKDDDRLVFMGDYINRGPDARGVLDLLIRIRDERPGSVFLMGNHEYALLEYARHGDVDYLHVLRSLGVETTLKSYGVDQMQSLRDLSFLPVEHLRFMEELELQYWEGGYLFAHAGVALREDACTVGEIEAGLSTRPDMLLKEPQQNVTVIFGHTAFETPYLAPGLIGIDTGAVYGNLLTAVQLPELRFLHS